MCTAMGLFPLRNLQSRTCVRQPGALGGYALFDERVPVGGSRPALAEFSRVASVREPASRTRRLLARAGPLGGPLPLAQRSVPAAQRRAPAHARSHFTLPRANGLPARAGHREPRGRRAARRARPLAEWARRSRCSGRRVRGREEATSGHPASAQRGGHSQSSAGVRLGAPLRRRAFDVAARRELVMAQYVQPCAARACSTGRRSTGSITRACRCGAGRRPTHCARRFDSGAMEWRCGRPSITSSCRAAGIGPRWTVWRPGTRQRRADRHAERATATVGRRAPGGVRPALRCRRLRPNYEGQAWFFP